MSSDGTFLNFAYGSNMATVRLQRRTPSAEFVTVAALSEHVLRWHKIGRMDRSGKCDAMFTGRPEDLVWGVVFRIRLAERSRLDEAEGLGAGYEERLVSVCAAAGPLEVQLYYATNIDSSLAPFDWYKRFVLHGAREHGLPADYIEQLERAPSRQDPDVERARKHSLLLSELGKP